MPSTYSPDLRLELPADGEQTGVWGQTANRNLGTLVESAVAGVVTVNVTAPAQALTALLGADDQSRHAVLVLTTALTADFAVYAPPASKVYVVRNNTSFVATLFNATALNGVVAAGVGVAIPAGKTLQVFSDGVNFRAVEAVGLAGTLAVENGGTGATTATGTGAVVRSVSPTFTGLPAAPTAAPGTNTAQLATTAFVQAALQALYPVGSIYTNASVADNPSTLLGFGTWVAFGSGRVMVGQDTADTAFDTLEETGGSKNAVVVSHTHTGATDAAGSHSHSVTSNFVLTSAVNQPYRIAGDDGSFTGGPVSNTSGVEPAGDHAHTFTTSASGVSGANANLPPYVVVRMWKRTA